MDWLGTIISFKELLLEQGMSWITEATIIGVLGLIIKLGWKGVLKKFKTPAPWSVGGERDIYIATSVCRNFIGLGIGFIINILSFLISSIMVIYMYKENISDEFINQIRIDIIIDTVIMSSIGNIIYFTKSKKIIKGIYRSKWIDTLSNSYLAVNIAFIANIIKILSPIDTKLLNLIIEAQYIWHICMFMIFIEVIISSIIYDKPIITCTDIILPYEKDYKDEKYKTFILENIREGKYRENNESIFINNINENSVYEIPKTQVNIRRTFTYKEFDKFVFPMIVSKIAQLIKKLIGLIDRSKIRKNNQEEN